MKNTTAQSNSTSNKPSGSAPDRQQTREAGLASQAQRKISNDTSAPNAIDGKQQASKTRGSAPQQQSDTDASRDSEKGGRSPSRDQGHSPSGSSESNIGNNRSKNSPRQTDKKN